MIKLRCFALAGLAALVVLAQPSLAQITTFSFERTFLNPAPDPGDGFGSYTTAAVPNDVGGYKIAIGAPFDDTNGVDAGAVYVMDRATGGLIRTLYSPNPAPGDNFGNSVGAVGNNILVSASGDSSAGPARARGAVYLFDSASGALLLTLLPPVGSVGSAFGFPAVAAGDLNGDGKPEILVGAEGHSVGGIAEAGAAYLFDGSTGALLRTIENPEPGPGDIFGIFVAAEGGKFLIGAAWDRPYGVYQAGSAYLFDANSGALLRRFTAPFPEYQAHFGEWVALSQNRVVVTAHLADAGALNAGAAYIFDADTGALLHTLQSPAPEVWGQFGYGLAVTGSDVLIGASGENGGNGAAYLFDAVTGQLTWSFHPPTTGLDPSFGLPVGFVGRDVLVGAWGINTDIRSGSVSLFRRIVVADTQAPTWPSATLTASNIGLTSLTLTWTAAADNGGVANYRIYQGATLIGTVDATVHTFDVLGLTPGTQYTFKVEAGDSSGNWSTDGPSTTARTLFYHLCLLYDPFKIAKSGSTIPIKLQLCDGSGNNLSSPSIVLHAVSVKKVSDSVSGTVQDSGNANPDGDFRYDGGLGPSGGYIFNLSTKGLAGGTYDLNFTAGSDSSVYKVPFEVKS